MTSTIRTHSPLPLVPWPASLSVPEPRRAASVTPNVPILTGARQARDGSDLPDHRIALWLKAELESRLGSGTHMAEASFPASENCMISRITVQTSAEAVPTGPESYTLTVEEGDIALVGHDEAGLFYAAQTLLQLIQRASLGKGLVPLCRIADSPRFPYRGVMVDVARHFLPTEDLKKVIKEIASYKINRLHLHLTDDQGWRVEIPEYPELTERSSHTGVGGTGGGYYTCREVAELVEWGQRHHVVLIPEIDMPGHTAAAGHALPELNAIPYKEDGSSSPLGAELSEGTDVNISALAVDREFTFEWMTAVLNRLTQMFPGPYLHIGGDEAEIMGKERYSDFIRRALPLAASTGRTVMAWNDVGTVSDLSLPLIGQYWTDAAGSVEAILQQGGKIVLSPPAKTYLDLKHTEDQELGVTWAGLLDTPTAFCWEPADYLPELPEEGILGVESPLWTETIEGLEAVETMLFPRVCAVAERGWSSRWTGTDDELRVFLERVAGQSGGWKTRKVSYFPDPAVPWA